MVPQVDEVQAVTHAQKQLGKLKQSAVVLLHPYDAQIYKYSPLSIIYIYKYSYSTSETHFMLRDLFLYINYL